MPMRTGLIHWCRSCGCFASGSRARGLQEACQGAPSPAIARDSGRLKQRRRLVIGLHPKTGRFLGCADYEDLSPDAPPPKRQCGKGVPPAAWQQNTLTFTDEDVRVFEAFRPRVRKAGPPRG